MKNAGATSTGWRRLVAPKAELAAAVLAGLLLLGSFVLSRVGGEDARRVGVALAWASLAIGMVYGGGAALAALRRGRFDIDVLMIVGAGLAAYVGHPGEGALLLVLFVLSGALEDLAMARTTREVEAISTLMPSTAIARRGNAWTDVQVDDLVPGDLVKVRPGDRIPTDGVVTAGASSVDESAITGESMPRGVKVGDELFAGAINTDDPLEARVTRAAKESSLQKILDLVVGARESREPVQRVIDRLSQPYSLGVLGLSTIVALVWWLWLKRPLLGDAASPGALSTAITLLIVASPCALVIATPTATLAGLARAARGGVLFRGGQALERLSTIRALGLDKTGTLTLGRPVVKGIRAANGGREEDLLALAAGLEADSSHPIAAAIREESSRRGLTPARFESLNHVVARGIEGRADGARVRLGSAAFAGELGSLPAGALEALDEAREAGDIAVVVAREGGGGAGVIRLSDAVRGGGESLVPSLHAMGVRPVRMLTGDHSTTAARVAGRLGLDAFDAELHPQDKLRLLGEMRRSGPVGYVGDGVNDAPALAAADASMAMGTIGTAAAMESADAVILGEHLGLVPWALGLARRTRGIVRMNLLFALGVIVGMSVLTLVGSARGREVPLSLGVLAHEGGTLLVVANSLRLLWHPAPRGGRTR